MLIVFLIFLLALILFLRRLVVVGTILSVVAKRLAAVITRAFGHFAGLGSFCGGAMIPSVLQDG